MAISQAGAAVHPHRAGSGPAPWSALIVDGYATLDPQGLPGLGRHAARAVGIPVAAAVVAVMAGPHRIPTAVKRVDGLARGQARPVEAQ